MSLPLLHMDLVGSALSLSGMWLIYKKRWYGWLLTVAANVAFLYMDASAHLWWCVPLCLVAICISLRSAAEWHHTEQS